MRWITCLCFALSFGFILTLGACKEDVYFIPGTGTLPECTDAPSVNLDGSLWFDQGTVTILTSGCLGAQPNDMLMSCALNWAFAQNGNDVNIVVDEEYRLEGRLCGDQLYLRGGWWLPVVDDELGYCTYEDDSADEVGIMAEGNVLTYAPADGEAPARMAGTLVVQGGCTGEYEVVFEAVRDPSVN